MRSGPTNFMKKGRVIDWIMERLVAFCGVAIGLMVVGMFAYLALESRYAFDRKFPYGFRIAAQPVSAPRSEAVEMDPNASILTSHMDGMDGLDDKESIPMPTLAELQGVATLATGSLVEGDLKNIDPLMLARDNWQSWHDAGGQRKFLLFAFATPEHQDKSFVLRWEPDAAFDADLSVHNLRLKLIKAPVGIDAPAVDIDLRARPRGEIELPVFIARSDDERTQGYVFELESTPTGISAIGATLRGFFKTEWAPTTQYPRYGLMPLLLSTVIITILAILFAIGPALLTALYLSEFAPHRLREWLKPIIELLASIPTVVLGYFGLMIVAPGLMATVGKAFGMESGRSLLTAAVVMAVLIIPTIASIAEDGLRNIPRSLRDGAEALGLTSTESIRRVILPAARPALYAALLLGFARAIGETMIVWILSGGTPAMPTGVDALVASTRGIADTVGIEMANVEFEQPHYGHLFLIGLVLFAITIVCNLLGQRLARRAAWRS